MSDQERMEEIQRLLAERDKHKTTGDGGAIDYPRYDEWVHSLNDNGHIDYLFKRVKELEAFQAQWHEDMFGKESESHE